MATYDRQRQRYIGPWDNKKQKQQHERKQAKKLGISVKEFREGLRNPAAKKIKTSVWIPASRVRLVKKNGRHVLEIQRKRR